MDSKPTIRLQVYLSRSGAASRRHSAEIIEAGRVQVNQKTVLDPGFRVTEDDRVTLDGKTLGLEKSKVYVALHKPVHYLCSASDPEGRPLAIDLLKPFYTQRLFHVGRLDFLSSGLILFTNDGDWARKLTHPSYRLEKEYEVVTKKEVSEEQLAAFKRGIVVDRVLYRCSDYRRKGPRSLQIVLTEGKNREIRKVFQSWNVAVKRVHRVRIGCVLLKGLVPGRHRELTSWEIKKLGEGETPVAQSLGARLKERRPAEGSRRPRKTATAPKRPTKGDRRGRGH